MIKKILLGLCLTLPIVNQAQINPKVTKYFPAPVLFKIDEITSRIKLSEEKQMKLGTKIVSLDSLANLGLAKGESITELKKKYNILNKKALKNILSENEMDEYSYKLDEKNRFLTALHEVTKLKLEPRQISQIRKQNDILDSINLVGEFPRNKYCNEKLEPIMDKMQYASLIKLVYTKLSMEDTQKDWKKIQTLKLVSPKDSSTVFKQLLSYQLLKNSILDTQAEKYDPKKTDELRNRIMIEKRPPVLVRYQILSDGYYKKNIFSSAIKFEKDLNLTIKQIDTLLSKYRELEITKLKDTEKNQAANKGKEYTLFENSNIVKILDPKQVAQLLVEKNKQKAVETAAYNWGELEKKGFTKDLDKNTTLKEFANYQLRYLVADAQFKMNKNQINLFYKRDVELKKPNLLKQLDNLKIVENNQKSTKNELKW